MRTFVLRARGAEVTVVEVFPRLLPRQQFQQQRRTFHQALIGRVEAPHVGFDVEAEKARLAEL